MESGTRVGTTSCIEQRVHQDHDLSALFDIAQDRVLQVCGKATTVFHDFVSYGSCLYWSDGAYCQGSVGMLPTIRSENF